MNIPCPICKSNYTTFIGNKFGSGVYGCKDCYLIFSDSDEPNSSFYESDYVEGSHYGYSNSYISSRACDIKIDRIAKRRILRIQKYKTSVEIGAGSGKFVYLASTNGHTVTGIERSAYLRKVCYENYNIKLLKDLKEITILSEYTLTMIELIEHVKDPFDFLSGIFQELPTKPSYIFITTPNAEAAKILGIKFNQVKPPEHLNLYSVKSASLLMGSFNYKLDSVVRYQSIFLFYCSRFFGSRNRRKIPVIWLLTSFFRLFDPCICSLLPSRFSMGLEMGFIPYKINS